MTPIEIFEYKLRWKPGFSVRLHSDLVNEGKTWCRRNCERHQWSMTDWTDNYEHTFHFEHQDDSLIFETLWPKFINQPPINGEILNKKT
jgi:hypothetical protein